MSNTSDDTDSETPAVPRVLFVDDEPALIEGLRATLRREPFVFVSASSANEALKILASEPIDVVVSDERMPGMSGSEFLGKVRGAHPETVRIMLSGQASVEAMLRAINDGEVYRFLTKPCSPVQLAQTLRDALLIRQLSRSARSLLHVAQRQRKALEQLKRDHPGLTHVDRNEDGRIVLEEIDEDPHSLIRRMKEEHRRATCAS